jgi:Tfp pilus assembly protein PilF
VITLLLAAATAFGLVGNVELAASASAAETGSWASAQRLARAASRWQPWSAEPSFLLGESELAAGDNAGARQSLRRALALDPQDWRTWYELARVSPGDRRTAVLEIARLNPLAVTLRSGPASHDRGSAEGHTT